MNLAYRLARRFARFWVNRFFRRIQIQGTDNLPSAGAVIYAINHPNNLIDSLLVSYAIDRKIHYLATASLFRNRLLSGFLHSMGVIPVYRKQDDPAHTERNVATFEACHAILKDGGAIGIYPEGTTHAEPRVKRIKTGAARIALETEALHGARVRIVPVGLNFSARKSFRSDVKINIGRPIEVAPFLAEYTANPHAAVDELTGTLQRALEREVIHVETPEMEQLVRDVEKIYKAEIISDLIESGVPKKAIDSFRISQKLIDGIYFFNKRNPDFIRKIREEVRNYASRLETVRLQDKTLQRLKEHKPSYRRFLLRMFYALIGILPAAWGTVNHIIPYELSRFISRRIAKRETDYATARIVSGIVLYSMFYAAQIYFVWKRTEWLIAAIYGFTLPLFGGFSYYYWERFGQLREDVKLFFVMMTRGRLIRRLQEQRETLIAQLDNAKKEYLEADADI